MAGVEPVSVDEWRRLEALKQSVRMAAYDDAPAGVIARAEAFEAYLNADPEVLVELNSQHEHFEIGRTPIEPVWGYEECEWKRATA